jgi:signal transduction histidine kinase
MITARSFPRMLLWAGLAAWLGVCGATLSAAPAGAALPTWVAASLLFVLAFLWHARADAISLVALALQSAGVITMAALLCNGYEGLLLVLIAAQLGLYGNSRLGLVWIAAQTIALAIAVAVHWSARPALLLTPPYLGFQVLMFAAVTHFVEARRANAQLANANRDLVRLQDALHQKTRIEERLRIAQDMHDILGHHLSALHLNLELASHQAQGEARTTIRIAHSLARALLGDVKALVKNASDDAPVDLRQEIQQLACDLPRPKLHVSLPAEMRISDLHTNRALLHVVQEIVTNAIRHGDAKNLWLAIEQGDDRIRLTARDDGEAGLYVAEGFGLAGMRRRLEELGGTLRAGPATSGGFEVRAEVPFAPNKAA